MDLSVNTLQLAVQDRIALRDCSALVEKYERVAAELKFSFPEAWQTLDMLLPTEDKDVLHPIFIPQCFYNSISNDRND